MSISPRLYVASGALLVLVGAVIGIIFAITTHLADAHEDIVSEKEAYETALAIAQADGLADPVNYSIQRMTMGQWGAVTGDGGFNPEVVDVAKSLWVVAFTGFFTLANKPGTDGYFAEGETAPAGFHDYSYYAIALDAATGENISGAAIYAGKPRPIEATRPVPTGEYVETGAIDKIFHQSVPAISPAAPRPTPAP